MIDELYPALESIPEEGFVQRPANTSVYNAFLATNMPEALDKSGETSVIDYSKLIVSDGSLSKVIVTEATLDATGITIHFLPSLKNKKTIPRMRLWRWPCSVRVICGLNVNRGAVN